MSTFQYTTVYVAVPVDHSWANCQQKLTDHWISIDNVISCKWSLCKRSQRTCIMFWIHDRYSRSKPANFALPTSWRTTPCYIPAATCFICAISGGYLLHHVMVTKDPSSKRLWFDPLKLSSTSSFNTQELCTLPTHCIYMYGMFLRI